MRTYNDISTLEWYRPLEINSIDVCSSRTCQILYIHLRTETKATSNFRVLVSWVHSDMSPPSMLVLTLLFTSQISAWRSATGHFSGEDEWNSKRPFMGCTALLGCGPLYRPRIRREVPTGKGIYFAANGWLSGVGSSAMCGEVMGSMVVQRLCFWPEMKRALV